MKQLGNVSNAVLSFQRYSLKPDSYTDMELLNLPKALVLEEAIMIGMNYAMEHGMKIKNDSSK